MLDNQDRIPVSYYSVRSSGMVKSLKTTSTTRTPAKISNISGFYDALFLAKGAHVMSSNLWVEMGLVNGAQWNSSGNLLQF